MKKTLFILLITFILDNFLYCQQPDAIIHFDNGKATLNGESKHKLSELSDKIGKGKNSRVIISGFTDANGSAESNLTLSEKRALTVSDYLTAKGIEKSRITLQFFGEDKPVAKTENDLRENRRVEIVIVAIEKTADQNFYGVFRRRWKQPVKIRFEAIKVTSGDPLVMFGPEGTVIRIPPNSLCRANGELVTGDVDVELTECYKKSDILLANLHTASDSALLETGGMINVVARSGSERLSLKKGSEMKIEFPVSKKEKDMEVFLASGPSNHMNWERQSSGGRSGYLATIPKFKAGDKGYEAYDSTTMQQMSKIDNLVLSAGQLGWINCDRFYKIENKTNLSVEIDQMYHALVRLVFKNINCIIPAYSTSQGVYQMENIPVGQKATLVAFGMVGDVPYFALKDVVIHEQQVEKVVPKKTTFVALGNLLKKVD